MIARNIFGLANANVLDLFAKGGRDGDMIDLKFTEKGLARPRFSFSWNVLKNHWTLIEDESYGKTELIFCR